MNKNSKFSKNTRNSSFIKKIQISKKWRCDKCGDCIPNEANSVFMLKLNSKLDGDNADNYQLFCCSCSEKIIKEENLKPIKKS